LRDSRHCTSCGLAGAWSPEDAARALAGHTLCLEAAAMSSVQQIREVCVVANRGNGHLPQKKELCARAAVHISCTVPVLANDVVGQCPDQAAQQGDQRRLAATGRPPTSPGAAAPLPFKGSLEELAHLTAAVEPGTVIDLCGAIITSQVRAAADCCESCSGIARRGRWQDDSRAMRSVKCAR
jgi:hypothetical protein